MTYYHSQCHVTRWRHPEWRNGQVYFNTLVEFNPDWANEIRGTDKDPYYVHPHDHPIMKNFFNWLDKKLLVEKQR